MTLRLTRPFSKQFVKLPQAVQQKFNRQVKTLAVDFRHPSLHTKRIKGTPNIWEARIDYHHRFTFQVINDLLVLRRIGPHDILKQP